jgi:hypothetical protein
MKQFTMTARPVERRALVYCPICTHTVEAEAVTLRRSLRVKAGQKCGHCGSSLDAGYVIHYDKAA